MEWELKSELCTLSNNATDAKTRKEFLTFVVENMDNFDNQSWEMYISGLELTPQLINENIKLHIKIICKLIDINFKTDSYKTAFRLGYYEELTKI